MTNIIDIIKFVFDFY